MMQHKLAYPNYSDQSPSQSYNLAKWIEAFKNIHLQAHLGHSRQAAIDTLTKDWSNTERFDFLNWMKYYESGDQLKYKTAQQSSFYMSETVPNYYLPNPKVQAPSPIRSVNDQLQSSAPAAPELPKEDPKVERQRIIDQQRNKILGRLNSVEKLLNSQNGQIFAGADFERLLGAIYELKRQIALVNKVSLSAQTCVDLIIRQANILRKEGFNDASGFMLKLAQNSPSNGLANMGEIPLGGSQPQGQGSLGNNLPLDALTQHQPDPTNPQLNVEDKQVPQDGIPGFLENLEGAGLTLFDKNDSEDSNEAKDEVDLEDDVLLDEEVIPDAEIQVHAQMAPEEVPATRKKTTIPAPEKEGEQMHSPSKGQSAIPNTEPKRDNYDDLIDATLGDLKVEHILSKLEDISKIFRNREIARNLAIVDLMLNKLGLAEMFPSLGEITSKTLDSGQYCLTRLEDIISRLHASSHISDIALRPSGEPPTEEARKLKQTLQDGENKEREKKRLRQEMQDNQLAEKVKPEIENPGGEVGEQPASIEAESPAPDATEAPAPKKPAPIAQAPAV
jgi:hypothetical protein